MQRGCRTACRARAPGARAQQGAAPVQRVRPAPWAPGHSGSLRQSRVPGQGRQSSIPAPPRACQPSVPDPQAQRSEAPNQRTGPAPRLEGSVPCARAPTRPTPTHVVTAQRDWVQRQLQLEPGTGGCPQQKVHWHAQPSGELRRRVSAAHHRSDCRPADSERADRDRRIGYPAAPGHTGRQYLRHTGRQNLIISTPGTQARCQDPDHQ